MHDNQGVNKARALYYNLFENFFVLSKESSNYFELLRLIDILKQNPLDVTSGNALKDISDKLNRDSNIDLLQEFDDIFHNPLNKKIRQTASFYDEGVESGKKRVEMINFVAKTKLRRDEKNYFEYEDSVGFIFAFMAHLCDLTAQGEHKYENTVHCVFSEIINDFIDEFAKDIYEHNNSKIYKDLMIVLHSFIEFERLYLDVSKPAKKEEIVKKEESISQEELQRRARNKALKAQGAKKKEEESSCSLEKEVFDVEDEI